MQHGNVAQVIVENGENNGGGVVTISRVFIVTQGNFFDDTVIVERLGLVQSKVSFIYIYIHRGSQLVAMVTGKSYYFLRFRLRFL